jgi:hypothetical protein
MMFRAISFYRIRQFFFLADCQVVQKMSLYSVFVLLHKHNDVMLQRFPFTIPVSVKFTLPSLQLHYPPPHKNYPLWSAWVTLLMLRETYIFTDVFKHPQCCDRNTKKDSLCSSFHVTKYTRVPGVTGWLLWWKIEAGLPRSAIRCYRQDNNALPPCQFVPFLCLVTFCVWSHSAVKRKGRTNS